MADLSLQVTDIRYSSARMEDRERGLLGFVSFTLNGSLEVDGVTLRRSQAGSQYLAYPARVDGRGERHPYLRPVDEITRVAIEQEVLAALGQGGW